MINNASTSEKRLNYISNARIIGILLVVFGHSYPFNIDMPHPLFLTLEFVYCFHMPLFIFLSAYLVTKTKSIERHSPTDYITGRASRLLLPYIVLSTVCFVPKILVSSYINDTVDFSLSYFLKTIFIPRQNVWGHFWFLPVIFFMALFSVVYEMILKNSKPVAIIVCAITFALLFLPKLTDWFALEDIKKTLCYYTLGMIVGNGRLLEKIKTNYAGLIFIAVAVITFIVRKRSEDVNSFLLSVIYIEIAVFMITGTMMLCHTFDLTKIKMFKAIDKQGFAIFIMSWPVQAVVEILMNKILKLPVFCVMPAMFILGVAVPLIVTAIINYIDGKVENKIISKGLKYVKLIIGM